MLEQDSFYMQKCIGLAKIALENGESPVGSIIVSEGKIIGRGIEAGKATNDITKHAEILAVQDAIIQGFGTQLSNATLYTTHEPCIMCSYVIRHYKIPRIIFGLSVDFIGGATSDFKVLQTEDVPKWGAKPEVIGGVCEEECRGIGE